MFKVIKFITEGTKVDLDLPYYEIYIHTYIYIYIYIYKVFEKCRTNQCYTYCIDPKCKILFACQH